jgi:hypothetical protein
LVYRDPGATALTYCRNCKDTFDHWMKIFAEAQNGENLTNLVKE